MPVAPMAKHQHAALQPRWACVVAATATMSLPAQAATQWVQMAPQGPSPTARYAHQFVFDEGRETFVLFGGADALGTPLGDTWLYDGSTWAQASSGPPPRQGHSMAFHSTTQQVVLFGGMDLSFVDLDDTWLWDGTQWSMQLPQHRPAARRDAALVDFPPQGTVLLLGGRVGISNGYFQDPWAWNGQDRVASGATNTYTPRHSACDAYDAVTIVAT